jgi:tetrahydromethanopterin S-methyltransferase subunit G
MKEYWTNLNKRKKRRKNHLNIVNTSYLQKLQKEKKDLETINISILIGFFIGLLICIVCSLSK